jgi:hypothetical protein
MSGNCVTVVGVTEHLDHRPRHFDATELERRR